MYALVEIQGKQYKAEKDTVLKVAKLDSKEGEAIEFDKILLVTDKQKTKIGAPYVKGAKIKATVEEHGKDKKIIVFKYKRRKNYRNKRGHRQEFTRVRVKNIVTGS